MYKVEEAQRGKSVALLCRKILNAGATAVFKSEKEDCRHTGPRLFNSIVNKDLFSSRLPNLFSLHPFSFPISLARLVRVASRHTLYNFGLLSSH